MSHTVQIAGFLLGGVLLFGGGFLVGRHLGRMSDGERAEVSSGTELTGVPAGKFAESLPTVASLAEEAPASPPSRPMAQLRALVEINRAAIRLPFSFGILDSGQPNEDFVQIFALTPAERQELEVMITASKTAMAQMEAKLARIEPQADGGFTIDIPTFPKEGGEAYDQFVAKLESLLGPERSGYLREMHIVDSDRLFDLGGFGLVQSNFRLLPPGGGHESSWGTEGDPATGLLKRSGYFDTGGLRSQFPFIYERMRQAGQIAASPGP